MHGQVILRFCGYPPSHLADGATYEVLTAPAMEAFRRRFWRRNAGEPYADALGFASMSAAALGWDLVDETGRTDPATCAALVAEHAVKGTASVTPIAVAIQRRAGRD